MQVKWIQRLQAFKGCKGQKHKGQLQRQKFVESRGRANPGSHLRLGVNHLVSLDFSYDLVKKGLRSILKVCCEN